MNIRLWLNSVLMPMERGRTAEAVIFFIVAFLIGQIVFLGWFDTIFGPIAKGYWMFLLVVIAAIRMGTQAVILLLLLLAWQSLWGVLSNVGFFAGDMMRSHLVGYGTYLLSLIAVGLALTMYIERLKQTKNALLHREHELNRAQQVAKIGSWTLDVRSNVLTWTPESYRIFGVAPGTPLSYETFLACVHPDDRAYVHERWSAALTGEPYDIEHRVIANGQTIWVNERADLQFDAKGKLIGGIGITMDITERKRAHDALAMLSLAIEQSYNSIVITNAQAEIEFVNAAFTKITGYSPEEVLGRNPRLLNAGLTPKDTHLAMWQALSEGHTWHGEIINRCKNGDLIVVNQSISPIRQNGGSITHYIAINEDITEARRNTDELHRYRLQLENMVAERTDELAVQSKRTLAILRTMFDGVVHIDARGIILSVNDAITTLFGYEASELLGQNVSLLMPDPDRSAHDGYLARYGETHISTTVCGRRREVNGLHKDGSILSLELAVNELVDDRGSTFIGVLSDIRERKAIEAAHENTRRESERLSQLKSDFLANMSHELRTPLSAVIGLARICARENAGRKAHDTCTRIFNAGQHLLTVVNDILDFSKIAAGKLSIDRHPLRLSVVLDDAIELVAGQASTKGLELVRSYASPPIDLSAWVLGDALRIRQILVNLLSNAIKFTAQGRIELKVLRQGEQVEFIIHDEGIGMDAEQLTRIFNPFEQADSSTTRQFGGSGLGLSISMNLAQLMKGTIQAESTLGLGSTFTLRLPIPDTTASVDPSTVAEKSTHPEQPLTGVRVLAAEDVDVNRIILEDILDGAGATSVFVENGRLAVEQVTAHPAAFDIILMDIQMPEMDGHEAAQRIREITPNLPIVGLTAHAMMEERVKCLLNGMVDHITKPIDPDALISAILRWTQHASIAPVDDKTIDTPLWTAQVTANAPAPVVIDHAALNARFSGKTAFIRKLAQSVLDSQSESPAKLRHLAETNDFAGLGFLAHTLKGLAGNLSAESVREWATQLEKNR
ncbi:MAG: PAS domain S-box protein [Rhodocyclaceae bacterium]|nr:PAS domain S-box protein [Rhodocyclaceae bacterium]